MSVAIRNSKTVRAEGFRARYAGRTIKVVVTYASPQGAEAAIDELRRAGLPSGAELLFVVPSSMVPMSSSLRRPGNFPSTWYLRTQALPGKGLVGDEATEIARSWGADLIVVGSHGSRNIEPPYFACSSPGMAARAHCSVRIARSGGLSTSTKPRLLIAVDGSPGSAAAVREVTERAWAPGTAVLVVTVDEWIADSAMIRPARFVEVGSIFGGSQLRESRVALRDAALAISATGLDVSTEIRYGDPANEIVDAARVWGAGCVVVGSHGLGPARSGDEPGAGLGAVSEALASRAPFSVEIVRGRPGNVPRRTPWRSMQ